MVHHSRLENALAMGCKGRGFTSGGCIRYELDKEF